jgi:23S rRNA (cytidine1920-2'-O)/16S rRNA (cytidine1409-2'-O)-methyltransferase
LKSENKEKQRLDITIVERGLLASRQRARALIMAGKVLVNDSPVDKPGFFVRSTDIVKLREADHPYVSRGGLKLEKALEKFPVAVAGSVCLDVGASTGGFTDCLLQNRAKRVYAVDVGYGQIDWKLRQDPRVVVIERTNIRHMPDDAIPEKVDIITVDVSFISLKIAIPAVLRFLAESGRIIALIKPQFEVGKGMVGKGGVVRDPNLHQEAIDAVTRSLETCGLQRLDLTPSPIHGPKGNKEFLALYSVLSDS